MNRFSELKALVDGSEKDFEAFHDKNNQSAGTRIRAAMQQLKTIAQEIRVDVQDIKNNEVKG